MRDDGADLSGREAFVVGVVACLPEFVPKGRAAANPSPQMIGGCARIAFWEIHQGQFLLQVWANGKVFHFSFTI